jgi:type IV pilus assembly protein PilN
MIRINLLNVERKAAKKAGSALLIGQKITIGCSIILIVAALFVGWRYWTLQQESARLDKDIADAQQEVSRLKSIIVQVEQFEQQKAQLQQRVALIEELRKNQTGPVHMLDQVSRALPATVWLTELKQGADGITIDGRCTGLTSLSDFISNLEATGYFKRSIEIVSSQTEILNVPPGEVTKFSIKAQFQPPGS